jgi:hypothetical protein
MMLVVIIGFSVLALDGARFMSLQTQLQNGADALALAGAAELDRLPTSINRAVDAINNLVTNPSLFGSGLDRNVRVARIRFLRSLPVHDSDPVLSGNETADPTQATFVEVTVEPIGLATILPASFFGGSNLIAAGAQAVAGFDQVVCDFTPVFVCNPFETSGMSYQQATEALVNAATDPLGQRKLIRLAGIQKKSGPLGPGNFGYAIPTTGSLPANACGTAAGGGIGQAMAMSRPATCLRLSGVDLQPGNDQAATDGLNTRFDIYANGFSSCEDNYYPDLNVRKGFATPGNVNWCKAQPSSGTDWPIADVNAAGLPLDQNMITSTLGQGDQPIKTVNTSVSTGNGIWDCATYWSVAHYAGPGKNAPPPGCTNTATISRYSVYQYELNYLSDRSLGLEIGGPQCNAPGVANRRILNAAIINCGSSPVTVRSDARNVPVAAFGKFFLTLPAGIDGSLYAEFLGLIKPTENVNHDMVQLYR